MGKRDGKEIIYFTKDKNNKIRAYKQIVSNGSIEEIQKSLSNEKFFKRKWRVLYHFWYKKGFLVYLL